MIWRCACGRPNMEHYTKCIECGTPRPSAERPMEEAERAREELADFDEPPIAAPPTARPSWQRRQPPAAGFIGRTLNRIFFHYRRVLVPFLPGLVLLAVPIQLGYIHITKALTKGQAASWSTLAITLALTGLLTLVTYYLIILTAFSVRGEAIALTPFYTYLPWTTLGILWLATVLYGLAIFLGFLLVIVPGLAALTLLCLVQTFVVLDDATVIEALKESPRVVIGRGGSQPFQVLAIIVLAELILTAASFAILIPLTVAADRLAWPLFSLLGEVVVGGVLFPVHAVTLTILYDELVGIARPQEQP